MKERGGGGVQIEKKIGIRLLFVLMLYIKFKFLAQVVL